MWKYLLWFAVLVTVVNTMGTLGCLEEERIALLQVKAHTKYTYELDSWVDDDKSDCCKWFRVTCSNISRRVIMLDLSGIRNETAGEWYINASVFLSFKYLNSLVFAGNKMAGEVEKGGFDKLSQLSNLESLDLSFNNLKRSILSSLSQLSSLKYLNLDYNPLNSPLANQGYERLSGLSNLEQLSMQWTKMEDSNILSILNLKDFINLKELYIAYNSFQSFGPISIDQGEGPMKLETLDLSYSNKLNINIIKSLKRLPSLKSLDLSNSDLRGELHMQELRNLSNLEELFLENSNLHKDFLESIGSMKSLKVLSLTNSNLRGTLPNKGWCELKNLQELSFSLNLLEGMIPSCMGNLTSLRFVDLSMNMLIGNTDSSPLSTLMSLEFLSISSNSFEVPVSFRAFANNSNLRFILADENKVIAEAGSHSVVPKFQLEVFAMSNIFPRFLHYQHGLKCLKISGINLRREFPNWLLHNNTKLQELHMKSNDFTGTLELSSYLNHDLQILDVSDNKKLGGEIPNNLSSTFPNIRVLNLSYNSFHGKIPSHLGNLKDLELLDLSNNSFIGEIPKELLLGCSLLWDLKLSNNKLDGEIVQEFSHLSELKFLHLDGNNFTGSIPDNLSNLHLSSLDISDNKISGKIPTSIGHFEELSQLTLSKNCLEGPIPIELCKLELLLFLDLSENNLIGSIPSCLNASSIRHVLLRKNRLDGQLSCAFVNNTALVVYDLSHNLFSGTVPEWIGSISKLSILLLNGNKFEGMIPIQVCHLLRLSLLDLSDNQLTGNIPRCLSRISLEVTDDKSIPYNNAIFEISNTPITTSYHTWRTRNEFGIALPPNIALPKINFATKRNSLSYKGNILKYMSGIDLSSNMLTGEIPFEFGNLTEIHALNLSHNKLSGKIPESFSKLHEIESLDLSYNKLNGTIPNTLLNLNSLEVFSVAYNNLSGAIPDPKAQFGTFDESSYEGNPYLCGPPLQVSCSSLGAPSSISSSDSNDESEENNEVDMEVLYTSFGASYVVFFLGTILALYINPSWRNTLHQIFLVIVFKMLSPCKH